MEKLKKTILTLAIVGFASAHAGTITGAFVGVEALNLEPRNGDLDFQFVPPLVAGPIQAYSIRTGYAWAFRLQAGLNFCNHEDLTIAWLRDHTSYNHDSPNVPGGTPGIPGPSDVRWLTQDNWNAVEAHVGFNLDDVYGVYGHSLFLNNWSIRFAGGIDWLRFDTDMLGHAIAVSGEDVIQPPNLVIGYKSKSQFRGAGPRVDFDFTYNTPYNLGVFARTDAAVFIGKRYVSLDGLQDVTPPVLQDFSFTPEYVVVPKVALRLGINREYYFSQVGGEGSTGGGGSTVSLEAGWEIASYIHAIERPVGIGNLGINLNAFENRVTKVSNYSYQGWFAGVKVAGDWI